MGHLIPIPSNHGHLRSLVLKGFHHSVGDSAIAQNQRCLALQGAVCPECMEKARIVGIQTLPLGVPFRQGVQGINGRCLLLDDFQDVGLKGQGDTKPFEAKSALLDVVKPDPNIVN